MFGYFGCGKTYISEAIAKELGLAMVKLSPSDLFRGIVGESEARVRQITSLIESLAPVVVMIDEVDQIALARGKVMMTDSGVNRRVTNMLLDWLGQRNRKSFLVGCTNFLESMDLAFLRAGRVDEVCLVLPPDATARKEILELHCTKVRKIPVATKLNYQKIADETFMWTGAELEKLALDASRLAMEATAKKVTMKHFEDAMERVEVNVKQRSETIQGMVAIMKKMENVSKAFLDESLEEFAHGEKDRSRVKSFIENL